MYFVLHVQLHAKVNLIIWINCSVKRIIRNFENDFVLTFKAYIKERRKIIEKKRKLFVLFFVQKKVITNKTKKKKSELLSEYRVQKQQH